MAMNTIWRSEMLKIYGLANENQSCFVSGKREKTNVRVKFDDRSFSGVLSVAELVRQISRRENDKKRQEVNDGSQTLDN